jgi:hypothetical protein
VLCCPDVNGWLHTVWPQAMPCRHDCNVHAGGQSRSRGASTHGGSQPTSASERHASGRQSRHRLRRSGAGTAAPHALASLWHAVSYLKPPDNSAVCISSTRVPCTLAALLHSALHRRSSHSLSEFNPIAQPAAQHSWRQASSCVRESAPAAPHACRRGASMAHAIGGLMHGSEETARCMQEAALHPGASGGR